MTELPASLEVGRVKATATPWTYEEPSGMQHPRIYGGGKLIAEVGNVENSLEALNEHEANAQLIVQAVNERAALLAIIADLRDGLHYTKGTADLAMQHRDEAEAALAAIQSRLARAEELLRPFEAQDVHPSYHDGSHFYFDPGPLNDRPNAEKSAFTAGDVRAAKAYFLNAPPIKPEA